MFVDFESKIEYELKTNRRVCIHGVPGSGKTYFCKKFCQERDYITIYIDCKIDRASLKHIIGLTEQEDFTTAFKDFTGLSKFKNERIYIVLDNIDTSSYFEKVYYALKKAEFNLIMTLCVKNKKARCALDETNIIVKRPYSFFDLNDAYNSSLTSNTFFQMISNKEIPKFVHNSIDKIFDDYLNFGGTGYIFSKYKNDDVNDDDFDCYFQYQFDYTMNRIFNYSDLSDSDVLKCKHIIRAIAYQMLVEDKYNRFNVTNVAKGMTYNKLKACFDFLIDNNLIYQVNCSEFNNNNLYYFYDCGILKHFILQLSNELDVDYVENRINKMLTYNFVACELANIGCNASFWRNDNRAFVDFVFELNEKKYAVCINEFDKGHQTSLEIYRKKHPNVNVLCLSSDVFNTNKKIINCPTYSISCIDLLFD